MRCVPWLLRWPHMGEELGLAERGAAVCISTAGVTLQQPVRQQHFGTRPLGSATFSLLQLLVPKGA